jgi:NitT/TauT family transport system substrate-binding protein
MPQVIVPDETSDRRGSAAGSSIGRGAGMTDSRCIRWLALLALAATAIGINVPASAQDKPLAKVRIVAATGVLDVTYPTMTLPITLGYWKQEGYDVETLAAGGSLQATQQLVGGNAEFAAASAGAIIQANAKANLAMRVVSTISASDWSLAVDAGGPVKSVKDLRGKTIGVFNLATGGIAFLNGLLRANGMEPKDIDMVALGMGAAPVEAMRSGKVQALIYWGSATASFENAGLAFRKIIGDDWNSYPEYTLTTLQSTADKNPDMMIGIARGIVKAQFFALANPECAVKLHWARYQNTRAAGVDEATQLKRDRHSLETNLASNTSAFEQFGKGKEWGRFDPEAFERLSAFMLAAKQIDAPYDADKLGLKIPNLTQKINDFDKAAIQKSAKDCKF